jgi:hypothetical protein
MIVRCDLIKRTSNLALLIHENDELISIFATRIKTAKQNDKKLDNSTFLVRYSMFNIDAFVKSRKGPFFVIPAYEPESSIFEELQKTWTPFFNGVTTFYEFINIALYGSPDTLRGTIR